MTCVCHSGPLYASLIRCRACGHRSYDPHIGCERRACGAVSEADAELAAETADPEEREA